jgi:glycosidase
MTANSAPRWAQDALFYHIYPLGLCGAPLRNDFVSPPQPRLAMLHEWLPHLRQLGVTALYIGPLFESSAHGYDTADYQLVDRRLGTDEDLCRLVGACHEAGIKVILDAVYHHTGRDFWAFRDLQQRREQSPYGDWFVGVDFESDSPYGDGFSYHGWQGCLDLVKLNLKNAEVSDHLLTSTRQWVERYDIDGLRLDAADCLWPKFVSRLRALFDKIRPQGFLLGEAVIADYRKLVRAGLHSVTNYECYKGLYSSHNDSNYFEIAHSLKRQFADGGVYEGLPLYNFVDNHDVSRIASTLDEPDHLFPLHCLLFTMPGIPSVYYGSEWSIGGHKDDGDAELRPAVTLTDFRGSQPPTPLQEAIAKLSQLRAEQKALRHGSYQPLHVAHEQLVFARSTAEQELVVAVNASDEVAPCSVPSPLNGRSQDRISQLHDLLNDEPLHWSGQSTLDFTVAPRWARVIELR